MKEIYKIKTEYITLQQFLKLINISSSGGDAKNLIKDNKVKVNDEIENRRGRKLYLNDEVVIDGKKYIVG